MRVWVTLISALLALAGPLMAESIVAARNLRPGTVLMSSDLRTVPEPVPGAFSAAHPLIGLETKVAIYAGRPIMAEQVGPPATVERNQLVQLVFQSGGLSILAEGRALGRGSEGQRIRVMNLTSKSSLFGTIEADGRVRVTQ